MHVQKLSVKTNAVIPLMAALPYGVAAEQPGDGAMIYEPETQLTHFAGRDFSTCRCDESAGGLFQSKSDTKKDD